MRRILFALLVVLVVAIAVVALAPASLIDSMLADRTRGALHLADAAGTLRSGRGVLSDNSGTLRLPIAWHVALVPLLRGELEIVLDPEGDSARPKGVLTRRDGTLAVSGLEIHAPASSLRVLLPLTAPPLGGDLKVSAPDFQWGDRAPTGQIDAQWSSANIAIADATVALGDVRVVAMPEGRALRGTFDNRGGDVAVRGEFTLADVLDVSASLTPAPGAPADVLRVLAALGPPDANGVVRLAWHGRVR